MSAFTAQESVDRVRRSLALTRMALGVTLGTLSALVLARFATASTIPPYSQPPTTARLACFLAFATALYPLAQFRVYGLGFAAIDHSAAALFALAAWLILGPYYHSSKSGSGSGSAMAMATASGDEAESERGCGRVRGWVRPGPAQAGLCGMWVAMGWMCGAMAVLAFAAGVHFQTVRIVRKHERRSRSATAIPLVPVEPDQVAAPPPAATRARR